MGQKKKKKNLEKGVQKMNPKIHIFLPIRGVRGVKYKIEKKQKRKKAMKCKLDRKHPTKCQHASRPERPGGEFRLPAAIVPPPGLGKTVCKRKIDDQGTFLTLFAYVPDFASLFQVGTKRVPKLTQKGPKSSQKHRSVLIFASLF